MSLPRHTLLACFAVAIAGCPNSSSNSKDAKGDSQNSNVVKEDIDVRPDGYLTQDGKFTRTLVISQSGFHRSDLNYWENWVRVEPDGKWSIGDVDSERKPVLKKTGFLKKEELAKLAETFAKCDLLNLKSGIDKKWLDPTHVSIGFGKAGGGITLGGGANTDEPTLWQRYFTIIQAVQDVIAPN